MEAALAEMATGSPSLEAGQCGSASPSFTRSPGMRHASPGLLRGKSPGGVMRGAATGTQAQVSEAQRHWQRGPASREKPAKDKSFFNKVNPSASPCPEPSPGSVPGPEPRPSPGPGPHPRPYLEGLVPRLVARSATRYVPPEEGEGDLVEQTLLPAQKCARRSRLIGRRRQAAPAAPRRAEAREFGPAHATVGGKASDRGQQGGAARGGGGGSAAAGDQGCLDARRG